MSERFLLAVTIVALIGGVGVIARELVRARSGRLIRRARLSGESVSPRLLLFSTRFCDACETQRRVIDAERPTWRRPVEISYHDAVAESELARGFGILTVPALVVAAADGRVIAVNQGLVDRDRLRSLIEQVA